MKHLKKFLKNHKYTLICSFNMSVVYSVGYILLFGLGENRWAVVAFVFIGYPLLFLIFDIILKGKFNKFFDYSDPKRKRKRIVKELKSYKTWFRKKKQSGKKE